MTTDPDSALISFLAEHGAFLGIGGFIAGLVFLLVRSGLLHLTLGKPPPPPDPPKLTIEVTPTQLPSVSEGDRHQPSSPRPRKRTKGGKKGGRR